MQRNEGSTSEERCACRYILLRSIKHRAQLNPQSQQRLPVADKADRDSFS